MKLKIGALLALASLSVDAQELKGLPSVIFDDQEFTANVVYVSNEPCDKYTYTSTVQGDVIEIVLDNPDDSECLSVTPVVTQPIVVPIQLGPIEKGEKVVNIFLPGATSAQSSSLTIFAAETRGDMKLSHESPAEGELVSGVGLIRGWACQEIGQPSLFTFRIDDGDHQAIPYGSSRTDTQEACKINVGGSNLNTGYGSIVNWNALSAGNHRFRLYVDGKLEKDFEFSVAKTSGEFLTGLNREVTVDGFPDASSSTVLSWSQPNQNFIIKDTNE